MQMEGDGENGSGGGGRKLVGARKVKMNLEDYIDFFISRNTHSFTINFLNQIIHMHGFLKLHRLPKNEIVEAIDTLDLVEPWRSTLKQNVTSSAPTLEEVVADLECLKWQECCVTSLQIINAEKEAVQIAPDVSEVKHKPRKNKEASKKRRPRQSKGDDSLKKTANKKKNRKKNRVAAKHTGSSGDGGPEHVEEAYVPSTSSEVYNI